MALEQDVNQLLRMMDFGVTYSAIFVDYKNQSAVNEALQMGLIYVSGHNYLLTKEGIELVKSGRTYSDYLRERFPTNTPAKKNNATNKTNSHPGTRVLKRSSKAFIKILNNDWTKYTVTAIIAGIIVLLIGQYLSKKTEKKAPVQTHQGHK